MTNALYAVKNGIQYKTARKQFCAYNYDKKNEQKGKTCTLFET